MNELVTQVNKTSEVVLQALGAGATQEQLEMIIKAVQFADAREAERRFNSDITAMQSELPVIVKRATSHHGKYASYESIVAGVRPVMAAHGFSFRHEIETEGDTINVTCIVAHEAGHSEKVTLPGVADNSGKKNSIQSVGSTVSYLKRYTLCAALGIATSDEPDNDGNVPTATITEEQEAELLAAIESKGEQAGQWLERLLKAERIRSLANLPASKFEEYRKLCQ